MEGLATSPDLNGIVSPGSLVNADGSQPEIFLNYMLFNRDYGLVSMDAVRVSQAAAWNQTSGDTPETLTFGAPIEIEESGYLYIFTSNEELNPRDAFFDDFKVTHTRGPLAAGSDYYPFGLVIKARDTDAEDYRYGYQGEFAEKDDSTGWNAFQLRIYDPEIGRWTTVDPERQYSSPYVSNGNNPITNIDPDGAKAGPFNIRNDLIEIDNSSPCACSFIGEDGIKYSYLINSDGSFGGLEYYDAISKNWNFKLYLPEGAPVMEPLLADSWEFYYHFLQPRTFNGHQIDNEGNVVSVLPTMGVAPDVSPAGKIIKGAKLLSPQNLKSAKSLYRQMIVHIRKLHNYAKNPYAYDNAGHLAKNAGNPAVQKRIIEGRIRHLQKEIDTFYNNIIKLVE